MAANKRKLLDQVAIVTGASSGIGRAVALALAREGADIALAARNEVGLQAVAREVEQLKREALVQRTDVTDEGEVQALVSATLARWGRVDILVANAGTYVRRYIVELRVDEMRRAMDVNFYGVLYSVLAVLPPMLSRHAGHIVLVNTIDGRKGLPYDAPYVASKFALTGFGDVLRQELRGTGVHVMGVFPGRVDTPMIGHLRVPRISAKLRVETVARAIVRGIYRRQPEVIIPRAAKALILLNVISPTLADHAVRLLNLQGWETSAETATSSLDEEQI